jgi:hypothetical protein
VIVDELDNVIDNEDDLMEPASEPSYWPVSEPASELVIAALKQQCINARNDTIAAFLASLRDAFNERARFAKIGELFYWFQKLCNYYKKSLMSGKTLDGVNRLKCPSLQLHDYFHS